MKQSRLLLLASTLLSMCFLFNNFFNLASATDFPYSVLKEEIILDCGSSQNSPFNGVDWIGDVGSKFLSLGARKTTTISGKPVIKIPAIPYLTARVFHSPFIYSFPTSPGVKYIRLHFYPGIDNLSKAYFSVTTGRYTLLNHFSPSAVAKTLKQPYFNKGFAVTVREQTLNITFTPLAKNTNSFAFINGIEIHSVAFNPYNESAFEMMHTVNPGPDESSYIVSSNTGTAIKTDQDIYLKSHVSKNWALLYGQARTMGSDAAASMIYNLTWGFPVDLGFNYLVRLQFCEISVQVSEANQRVFTVYINNEIVEKSLDLVAVAGKPFVAIYRDYFVRVPQGTGGSQDILVALHPSMDSKPQLADAILNGVEIVKLSDENGNLAAYVPARNEMVRKKIPSRIVLPGVLGGFVLILFLSFIFCKFSRSVRAHARNKKVEVIISSDGCRRFALPEIKAATRNFSEALVVGAGGFGKVYKGLLDNGSTEVAIKRASPESRQGIQEFRNEIELLSTFRHLNLVSLIGFCQEEKELILVYDYMARGTLRDHLYNSGNPPLSWKKRLQISIGAARGLHYLHTGAKHTIIHRDIKSTNILLDQDWVAKVADFGLSRIALKTSPSHVSTEVKGTFGYLDPRYYQTRKLTEKSDVYSFGVVLFEILCARPAVNPKMILEEEEKATLAQSALTCQQNGTINHIIDPCIRGEIQAECLNTFVNTAIKCLADRLGERPSMGDILDNLEKALRLQEKEDMSNSL